jgi:hypothetical protein
LLANERTIVSDDGDDDGVGATLVSVSVVEEVSINRGKVLHVDDVVARVAIGSVARHATRNIDKVPKRQSKVLRCQIEQQNTKNNKLLIDTDLQFQFFFTLINRRN